MFCKICGKEILKEDKFCGSCGTANLSNDSEGSLDKTHEIETNFEKQPPKKASMTKRFLNLILDSISVYIFSYVTGIILGVTGIWGALNLAQMNETLLGGILFFLYYVPFETSLGKTPAKYITKTKVIMKDGNKASFANIFWKTLARLIPFEAFSFLSETPEGWHDKLSKTIVIEDN